MKHVPLHIDYLLTRHHCVAVAGIGAFLVNDVAAHFDEASLTFFPPSRRLGFNRELTLSDGLLAQSIARREGISVDEASRIISSEVNEFHCLLDETGQASFGNIGSFTRSAGGALLFEPSDDALCMSRYEGLPVFEVTPLTQEAADETEVVATPSRRDSSVSVMLKAVASVLLLFVLGSIIYATTGLSDSLKAERAMLDSNVTNRLTAPVEEAAVEVSRPILLNIAAAPSEPAVEPAPEPAEEASRYLLVVASLESRSSALRHIGSDTSLHVINMDGKYRVYVDSFATLDRAVAALPSYRDRYENVWVCTRAR